MSKERRRISVEEFRAKGYLQELNRRFLHPLGLALEVSINETDGSERFSGVWDCRDDEEGIFFDIANSSEYRRALFLTHASFIDDELESRSKARKEKLGYVVEPIEGLPEQK